MSADRRGFHYALAPVLHLTAWQTNELAHAYAQLQQALRRQQGVVDDLQQALAVVNATPTAPGARIDIHDQQRKHLYLKQLQQALLKHQAELAVVQQAHDSGYAQMMESRKLGDCLERDQQAAARDHDAAMQRRGYIEADDAWQQRTQWRNL